MKNWLLEVGLKTFGPSAVRGAVLGIGGFLAAKSGALEPFGVLYDTATHIVTIHLDKLNLAFVALLPALGAGLIKVTQKQTTDIVKPKTEETPK